MFITTGSVLVSAAHCGAYVWGWDIDYLTLHARTKPTRHAQVNLMFINILCLVIFFFFLHILKLHLICILVHIYSDL